MKKENVLIIVFIFIVAIYTFHFAGLVFVNELCEFYYIKSKSIFRLIVLVIGIPIIGFLITYFCHIKKERRFLFTLIIPFVFINFGLILRYTTKNNQLKKYEELIIRKAIVKDIFIGNSHKNATVKVIGLKHEFRWYVDIKKYDWRDLKVGDSILVIYAKDCTVLHQVYELYPSKEQFKQFEKNPYYDKFWNK